ncbi:hypothetical protein M758_2G053300 [Ceratodon purpureus]|uniref:Uncharacterized protein n=1 Tax=Ceratodon purpureus TaxID=3225 RepID=A0A8T0IUD6_CERPU|nr:hypothetical protein KC19_2G054100 [Ceratodon purpureus]KAG0625416.1 hypothetical protein M758_2G053300 [Ceratodon purpureus]
MVHHQKLLLLAFSFSSVSSWFSLTGGVIHSRGSAILACSIQQLVEGLPWK